MNQVIRYVTDINKTELLDLEKSLESINDESKTENKLFVSGINCNPNTALKDIMRVKKRFNKQDGILGYHAYQSFKEGEVTPEKAHEIGLMLAKEVWGDRFQVLVATHLNTNHYHNHFVINSVSFVDGKKYYDNRTTYAEFRRLNDCICKENNLSFLEENKTKSGINYLHYQNKSLSYTNYYKRTKEDLDLAIAISRNYKDFITILENMNYKIIYRSGKLSIRGENYKRNIRIERYYGEDYSIENIKKQIEGTYIPIKKNYYFKNKKTTDTFSILLKPKYNTFYGMYIRYCNLLNNYPDYIKRNKKIFNIRDDVSRMEELSNIAILLAENTIETEEQFFSYYQKLKDDYILLKSKKENKSLNNKEELQKQILEVSKKINLCKKINDTKDYIKENIKEMEEKEVINNEHIK